jgi:colicin import membrane protein
MIKALPVALLALSLQGCLINSVSKLSPEASKVQLVPETEKPSECKFLGKIVGTSHAEDEKDAKQGAENDFRNKAAAKKGNFAVIENSRGGRMGTTSQREVVINGKAYYCKTLEMQQAEEEKAQAAIQAKEEREAKEEAEREAAAEEAKAKREQQEKERAEKAEAEEQEKKDKKSKKKSADD